MFDQLMTWLAFFVLGCSLLSMLLPPVEFFDTFPRFQKFYTIFVKIVAHWGALNLRAKFSSTFYKTDFTQNLKSNNITTVVDP